MAVVLESASTDAPDGVYVDPRLVTAVSEAVRRVTGVLPPHDRFESAIRDVLADVAAPEIQREETHLGG